MEVEIAVECKELQNFDLVGKSDPFVVLVSTATPNEQINTTEVIHNCSNPRFLTRFRIPESEINKVFRLDCFDDDSLAGPRTCYEYIGSAKLKASKILKKNPNHVRYPLTRMTESVGESSEVSHSDKYYGIIELYAQCIYGAPIALDFVFDKCGRKVIKSELRFDVETFIGGSWCPIYRSATVSSNVCAVFETASLYFRLVSDDPGGEMKYEKVRVRFKEGPKSDAIIVGSLEFEADHFMKAATLAGIRADLLEGSFVLRSFTNISRSHQRLEFAIMR